MRADIVEAVNTGEVSLNDAITEMREVLKSEWWNVETAAIHLNVDSLIIKSALTNFDCAEWEDETDEHCEVFRLKQPTCKAPDCERTFMPRFVLADDGTLDTVIVDTKTQEEHRFSFQNSEHEGDYDSFVDACIKELEEEAASPIMAFTE